ncbi:potassium channel family protein [Kitasatospora cinereorecta]|uniref:Potassium channel family protein n=1 Tax=Kitasatospora cinereorecta TaxID=285560 RepID=A0ABW0VE56_9ACTN
MARIRPVERKVARFLRTPLSVRRAMSVIVTATLVSVVLGGALITVVDEREFASIGTGLWWALQTVTTVGYGDVTPHNMVGRLVGAVIMLESTAFIAIVTAVITSSFVTRARQEQPTGPGDGSVGGDEAVARLTGQLAELSARLDRIQQLLETDGPGGGRRG